MDKPKILIPIYPKWCEKIFNGEKTIEVRKTAPKIDTPFEVLVYCTKAKSIQEDGLYLLPNDRRLHFGCEDKDLGFVCCEGDFRNGMVIGSFVCDKVDEYKYHRGIMRFGGELGLPTGTTNTYFIFEDDYKAMCLSYDEVKTYGKGKTLRGLHITEPKLFDEPKELSEFGIARAPQSWMYIKEVKI